MAIAALLSTAGATNATLYAPSNLTGMLAESKRLLPSFFGKESRLGRHAGLYITGGLVLLGRSPGASSVGPALGKQGAVSPPGAAVTSDGAGSCPRSTRPSRARRTHSVGRGVRRQSWVGVRP